jgi:hypothetical protein
MSSRPQDKFFAILWIVILAGHAAATQVASINTPNLFSGAAAYASGTYLGLGAANATDGMAASNHVLLYSSNNTTNQFLDIYGFDATQGIASVVLFDTSAYYSASTAQAAEQVKIYYSLSSLAANLNPGSFIATNGGSSYVLAVNATDDMYTMATDPVTGNGEVTISGLAIPANTQSLLIDFMKGTNDNGSGISEVEVFAAPEPGTWALLLAGAGLLAAARRWLGVRRG